MTLYLSLSLSSWPPQGFMTVPYCSPVLFRRFNGWRLRSAEAAEHMSPGAGGKSGAAAARGKAWNV